MIWIRSVRALLLVIVITVLSACAAKREPASASSTKIELTVSAAASLQDSLQAVQKLYELRNGNVKLLFNFGGSGALQQQIAQGAPVDLFLSAGSKQVKALVDQQLVSGNELRTILTNELVLITAKKGGTMLSSPNDLMQTSIKKIAVGEPGVPAGDYARESLTSLHIWSDLQPKLVLCKDVRQVLTYVESGNAEAGVVYKSDALSSNQVKVVAVFGRESHSPIEYVAAVIRSSKHKQEAKQLFDFLQTKEAVELFKQFGFQEAAANG